jgi:hypothetical protein
MRAHGTCTIWLALAAQVVFLVALSVESVPLEGVATVLRSVAVLHAALALPYG